MEYKKLKSVIKKLPPPNKPDETLQPKLKELLIDQFLHLLLEDKFPYYRHLLPNPLNEVCQTKIKKN